MDAEKKITGSDEAWENGVLGNTEEHTVALSDSKQSEIDAAIDESLGLCPISIRLERSLIEDFKNLATINKLGYQTLMRQALKRFADCEKKRLVSQMAAEMAAETEARKQPAKRAAEESKKHVRTKEKKAA